MDFRGREIIIPERRRIVSSVSFVVVAFAAVCVSWFFAPQVVAAAPTYTNSIPVGYVPLQALISANNASLAYTNSYTSAASCPAGLVLTSASGTCVQHTIAATGPDAAVLTPALPTVAPSASASTSHPTTYVKVRTHHVHNRVRNLRSHRVVIVVDTNTSTTTPAATGNGSRSTSNATRNGARAAAHTTSNATRNAPRG